MRTLSPERLLLIVGDSDSFDAFRRVADQVRPGWLSNLAIPKGGGVGSMRGFIAFGPEFAPRFLPLERSLLRWTPGHPYLDGLRMALRPIFEALGLPWKRPPFPVLKTVVIATLMALVLWLQWSR